MKKLFLRFYDEESLKNSIDTAKSIFLDKKRYNDFINQPIFNQKVNIDDIISHIYKITS